MRMNAMHKGLLGKTHLFNVSHVLDTLLLFYYEHLLLLLLKIYGTYDLHGISMIPFWLENVHNIHITNNVKTNLLLIG